MSNEYDETNKLLARALARCVIGDQSALSSIYETTTVRFTAVVKAQVESIETTREILKRAYVSIWLNAPEYDPSRATALSWMLVILRRCAADALQDHSLPPRRLHPDPRLEIGR